jgi:transposase InsO family protein
MQHPNARLTPTGRLELVKLVVEQGKTFEQAAACSNVRSKSTVWTWVRRWCAASEEERRTLACLEDRSSRPHRSPGMLAAAEQQRICAERRRTGWGPRLIASLVGHPHSTVHAALRRHGLSRPPKAPREAVVRYEWPCPGDLLHMDTKRFGRFSRPGHAVTGDRHTTAADKREKVGYEFAHSIVDDHSRYAITELHSDERGETVVAFVRRALDELGALGVRPKRILTDNAWIYTHNRALADLLHAREIRHLTTRSRRPQTNGKVERYQQTLKREWGRGKRYRSSDHRARALPHWLRYYNEQRRHSEIGNRPPTSRVRNHPGQDS